MDNIRILEDSINAFDKYQLVNSKGKSKHVSFHTEVEAFNEFGERMWKDHNELLLEGGLFTLSKISGLKPPLTIKSLNSDFGVQATETDSDGPRANDVICGFVIGISGCGDVFDTVKPVYYKDRRITTMVPFRKIEVADTATIEEVSDRKYYLKVTKDGTNEYYLKKFESKGVIKAEYEDGTPVDANVADTTDDRIINTYIQYTLKINKNDVREWFKMSLGNLKKCRVNSLALVHGYMGDSKEYKGVRCFSNINFNNEPFDNETKELTVIYKIYI